VIVAEAPPIPLPTPVPLTLSSRSVVLPFGGSAAVQVSGVYGQLTATATNPVIARVTASQDTRQLVIMAKGLGNTTVTVRDARGTTAEVAVAVEMQAGRVAPTASIRITGAPASALFVADEAAAAALAAAEPATGSVLRTGSAVLPTHDLDIDGIADVAVPMSIRGNGLYPVDAVTHVRVENFAQPQMRPSSLLVSDFPESLRENGLLYTATLKWEEPMRLLFYHANPVGKPHRWIVLQATNRSEQDTTLTLTDGSAGPDPDAISVGHLSTERFLVHESQNESTVIKVPAQSTVALVSRSLPAGSVVCDLLQLQKIGGAPLDLALSAQERPEAVAGLDEAAALLTDTVKHARGRYPIPEFFYDVTYNASAAPLEIPVGELPLPNLRQGIALAGDYGVLFSVNATLINDGSAPAEVALYANPRGGRATGTFLIDRALVQAHALPPYSHFKIKQYTIPAHGFVNVNVVTMPEGGSSYPLNLIFAPDDGSISPGAPGSPIY
jgi:hypothetical protein